jgi:hypothetical protein
MFRKLKLPTQEQEQGCFNKILTSNNLTNQFWKPALPTKRITHKLKTLVLNNCRKISHQGRLRVFSVYRDVE